MVSLRLCALLTAVAAVTTPPSHRETTALRGGFSAFYQKAGAVPSTVFGKESGARRLLERLRNGREPVPIAPSGDGDAVGARPALELEAELRDAAWRYGDNGRSVASVQNTYDAELEARAAPAALRSDDAAARAAREAAWVAATGTNLKRLENVKAYVPPPGVAYVPRLAGARDEFAADEPAIALDERRRRRRARLKTAEPGLASFQRQRIAEEEAKQTAQPRATEPGLASLQRQRVAEEEANGAARRKAAELGLASLQRQRVAEEEAKRVAEEGAGQLDEFVADEPAIVVEDVADEPAIVVSWDVLEEAPLPAEVDTRSLRAEGEHILEGEWAEQAELDAAARAIAAADDTIAKYDNAMAALDMLADADDGEAAESMSHFASTAGAFKGKDRDDFKSMDASSGPDWLSGSAAPAARRPAPPPPAAAAASGNMDHFASTAGSFKGKDRDFKSMGASSGPDWLSGSGAPAAAPAAAAASGNMDHFASTAGSFKAKVRDFKATGASSGPDWLSGSGFSAAPPAAAATAAASGNMDHFASTAGAFKGKVRDFKATGASSGPDWLSGSGFSAAPPAAAATAAASGNMDHFASTAGAFKGKDRDFKAAGASSGPDWLSGSGAPAAPPAAAATAAASGNMDHFASTAGAFKGKDRDFKATGASSGPDWLAGSAFAAAAPAAPAAPAAAAASGNMDHFASTTGAFKGKDRDFKATGASSGPDWLSGSGAPATAATAAASGNMDHFASTAGAFKGKDRDFKATGASSGPDWLSGSGAPRPATAAASGNMDHFASTAGAFKGKDRDFKATGASSGPDWLSGSGFSAAPRAAATAASGNMDHFASTAGAFKGKDRDFKAAGASSGPDWLSSSAVPAPPAAPAAPAKAGGGGNMDHFASSAAPVTDETQSLRAEGERILESKWAEQAEREAAWTAASVANLEQLRVAEAKATQQLRVAEAKAPQLETEQEASLPVAERRLELRAEGQRVLNSKWAEQAEREAAWTAASVASLEQLRVAEAEAVRLKAEQEALFAQQRVAEEQAVTTEQEAPLPVEVDTRSLRAEGERILESKWAAQAEREAAWTAASVASLEQLRVAEAEAPQRETEQESSLPVAERRLELRAEGQRVLNSKWAEQAEREAAWTAASVASLEGLRIAEAEAVRLKAEQEALFEQQRVAEEQAVTTEQEAPLPVEVDTRSLRAEGERILESKWAAQAEREAAWTAASVASLEGLRAAEAEAVAKLEQLRVAEAEALANLEQLRVAEAEAPQLETEQEASLPVAERRLELRAEGQRVLNSKWAEQAEREAAWTAASVASLEGLRIAEAEAARLKAEQEALFEQQRVAEEQAVTTEQEAPLPAEVDTRSLRAEGERVLESKWAEQAEREAAWTAASAASLEGLRAAEAEAVAKLEQLRVAEAEALANLEQLRVAEAEAPQRETEQEGLRIAEAEAVRLKAEQEALFEQQRVAEEEAVTTEQEAPLPVEVDTRSLRAEGERILESKWAAQAEREAAWTAASVASLEGLRVAEAEAVAKLEQLRVAEAEAPQLETEQQAPLPVIERRDELRAEGQRVLNSKWAEQAEREAAWTAASVSNLEQLRVAEAEAARRVAEAEAVTTEQEAPLLAEVDTRLLRAEGESILESKWAAQAEREAAWTAASLKRLRVAEKQAAQLKSMGGASGPDWLSGSAAASSAASATDETRSLRAEGERVLESKWAEQAEREAAWTAASVASLEGLRIAEAEAVRLKAEQEALFAQQRVAEEQAVTTEQEAPLPVEVDTRSLRAEGQRVLNSKWAEQAEREAAWTAASVASLEGLRVAEAEAVAKLEQLRVAEAEAPQLETEQQAPLPVIERRDELRAEGQRVLNSKWAEQAEREAAWTAASVSNLEQLRVAEAEAARRVAEAEAVTTEQEAPLLAEVDTRLLRAEGESILESKWAAQAEREAAWTAASLKRLRVAEKQAAQLKSMGGASGPDWLSGSAAASSAASATDETRSLRAEGERVLESKWAEQAEREAAWTAASAASLEGLRIVEEEAPQLLAAEEKRLSLRAEGQRVVAGRRTRQLRTPQSSPHSWTTFEQEAPLPVKDDTRSLRAEGERVLNSKWAEQAEREAAWTAASVASLEQLRVAEAETVANLEQLRVAEAEAARLKAEQEALFEQQRVAEEQTVTTEQEAPLPVKDDTRSLRAEGERVLNSKWAEQAEREAAWTASSVASLEQLRVAEAETVANLEQLRVAEAEAARLKAEQEALFEQQRVAEEQTVTTEQEAPLPVKDDTRSLRAEGERAEREAAWTAASVASLEGLRAAEAEAAQQLRVAEAEVAQLETEQEASLPAEVDTRSLRAEGERVLESKWAEQAEREAAWIAASAASLKRLRVAEEQAAQLEQQRVSEEQAVTTEQEAPPDWLSGSAAASSAAPAEVDTRSLRADGERILESKWAEQAEREAAWTASSVASFDQPRPAEAEAVTIAEEAPLPAEVDTRSLRAEGERVLESKWAEQAEREAAWTASSVASFDQPRPAEAEAVTIAEEAPPGRGRHAIARAEGERVLESKWAEQAEREAA
ncbi:ATPase [Aureococcus anophagefferens]|nr:ATPase [Aureococcus anophagefferens]